MASAASAMSYMRGKFYVYGTKDSVHILHGRDITEESNAADLKFFAGTLEDPEGLERIRSFYTGVDPVELRTGVTSPESVWLPYEVFNALVVRAYKRMTPAERKAASGDTRWEKARA